MGVKIEFIGGKFEMAFGGLLVIVGFLGLIVSLIFLIVFKMKKRESKKINKYLGIFGIVFIVGVVLCVVLDNDTSENVNSSSDSTSSISKKENLSFKLKDDENMIDSDLNGAAVISGTAKPNTQINLVPDDDAKEDGFKRLTTKSDNDGNFKFTVNVNEKQIVEVFHLKAIDHKKKEVTIFSEVKSSTEESSNFQISESSAISEEKSVQESSNLSREQRNAIKAAENYISMTSFSQSGLKEQLVFDGYPDDSAQYAVEQISVDWNEQALKSAENYLDMTAFSNQELLEQLVYDGFTDGQAQYAINNLPK